MRRRLRMPLINRWEKGRWEMGDGRCTMQHDSAATSPFSHLPSFLFHLPSPINNLSLICHYIHTTLSVSFILCDRYGQVTDTLIDIFINNPFHRCHTSIFHGLTAERTAVETPVVTFNEQLGFAPSQIIPVKLAIIFCTA